MRADLGDQFILMLGRQDAFGRRRGLIRRTLSATTLWKALVVIQLAVIVATTLYIVGAKHEINRLRRWTCAQQVIIRVPDPKMRAGLRYLTEDPCRTLEGLE